MASDQEYFEDHWKILEAQEREDFEFERAYWEEQERIRDLEYEEALAEWLNDLEY